MKFLAGSFSAVPKRNFARKYAFDSIFQALQFCIARIFGRDNRLAIRYLLAKNILLPWECPSLYIFSMSLSFSRSKTLRGVRIRVLLLGDADGILLKKPILLDQKADAENYKPK